MTFTIEQIKEQARTELEEEQFKNEVEKYKTKLRKRKNAKWWERIFPYSIKVIVYKKFEV